MQIDDVYRLIDNSDIHPKPHVTFFDGNGNKIDTNQSIAETKMCVNLAGVEENITIVKCIDKSVQEEYESRLINYYVFGKKQKGYSIIIHKHRAMFTQFMDKDAGIIYIRDGLPYQIDNDCVYFLHQDYISNRMYPIKLKITDQGLVRLPKNHAVEWLDMIEDSIDSRKNPINKPYWNDVYFKDPPPNTYEGEKLFIVPDWPNCLIKLESTWVKTSMKWLRQHINLMPQDIQNEFALATTLI